MRVGQIPVFALSLLLLPAAGRADELRLDVSFAAPDAQTTPWGDLLRVPGCDLRGVPGAPLLPARSFTFVLPYGHAPAALRVERIQTEIVAGAWDLAPAQRPQPLSRAQSVLPTPRDPAVYLRDAPVSGTWAQQQPVQFKHGYSLTAVTVHPLVYQPLSGRVTRLVSATLVLTTQPSGRVPLRFRALAADRKAVAARAEQTAALASYPAVPVRGPTRLDPGDYDYLIIAPEAFIGLGSPNSLEDLRDLREGLGMSAQIVSLEWILANYTGTRPDGGQDDATRVREFLADAYAEWTVDYVLLVGDADAGDAGGESGDDLFPVRKLYVNVGYPDVSPDRLPADLYFSCLDGDFDLDADGVYGEPGDGPDGGYVDLMAELHVGRAPVDSAEELQHFVAKTLAYESGAGAWLEKVLMVGELLWDDPSEVWAADAMDELNLGSDAGGFTTVGFSSFPFFLIETLYDRDMPAGENWVAGDLIPLLDDGPHIVNHLGHSNVTYNMRLVNYHVDGLLNPHPFFHYSQGCYNGSFDNKAPPEEGGYVVNQDAIAEHLVTAERAAFATVSNSRYGWGSSMTDGPSQRFHRQFWDAFFGEGVSTIGQALVDSKEDNADSVSDPFIRWVAYESNLLGDPAVMLKKSLNTTDPLLGVYPPQLYFIHRHGDAAPAPQTMAVRNDGLASLSFSVSADQPWLTVTPGAGDAPADIEISVDPTGLEPGLHSAQLTFASAEAANSPLTATVEYMLVEVPEIRVPHGPGPLVDGVIDSGEYDHALALPIGPEGSAEVMAYLIVADGKLNLAIDDLADTSDTEFDGLQLFFDKNQDGLWPSAPGGDEGYYAITARRGGRRTFYPVFNDGTGTYADRQNRETDPPGFEAMMGFGDNHRVYEIALDLALSHVDVGPTGTFSMFFEVQNAEDWGGGAYTGFWPAYVPEIDDQNYFGRVVMMPEEPWLACLPSVVRFEAVHNRAAPAPETVTVLELLGGAVPIALSAVEDWIQVESAGSSTPTALTVTVDTGAMDIGANEGTIWIESAGLGNSPLALPVQVDVLPEPAMLAADPPSFDLIHIEGDADPVLTLRVQNLGEMPMGVVLSCTESWLGAAPVMFGVDALAEQEVNLSVAASGLAFGEYAAAIRLESESAEGGGLTVPFWLTVRGPNNPPPVPTLLSPADGARVSMGLALSCVAVTDPDGDEVTYTFTLTDGDGNLLESGVGDPAGERVVWQPTEMPAAGHYRWQVEARDGLDASAGGSAIWSFKIGGGGGSGCDCGTTGAGAGSFWLLALGGLLLLRRRCGQRD